MTEYFTLHDSLIPLGSLDPRGMAIFEEAIRQSTVPDGYTFVYGYWALRASEKELNEIRPFIAIDNLRREDERSLRFKQPDGIVPFTGIVEGLTQALNELGL